MNDESLPVLSAILTIPDCYETVRRTVGYLRKQTIAHRMELVFVAPEGATMEIPEDEMRSFHSFRAIFVPELRQNATGYAVGIQNASAPIVVFTEDHVFADEKWAEALLARHQEPWMGVGPQMENANPEGMVSWASLLVEYGPWISGSGKMDFIPGHNSSFKRDVLLEYGDDLEGMLISDTILHWDLVSKGHTLYVEPAAKLKHLNFAQMLPWLDVTFYAGRVFASARSKEWSFGKRLFYAAASPLIPLVRFRRTLEYAWEIKFLRKNILPIASIILTGLIVDGIGQFLGYCAGSGSSVQKLCKYEFHRDRFI